MPLPDPVIVVPGITASYLKDTYALPPETVWSVLTSDYERAALHPNDLAAKSAHPARTYEAQEPARVLADQVFGIAYSELVKELRFNLRSRADHPVPVYPFGYDWRQPLEISVAELGALVDEVIERTMLMRHYFSDDYAKRKTVNLVGHSMGGLVIADYLGGPAAKGKVGKVATLATPFQGSFEVVVKVTTGTANLGVSPPSSRERESARVTPALYYLVPSFKHGLFVAPGLPDTLFDPGLWQPSIVETIAEFIRLRGRESLNQAARRELARKIFAGMLGAAKKQRRRMAGLDLAAAGLKPTDWLCVVGVDVTTRVDLNVDKVGGAPAFAFRSSDRSNQWATGANATARRRTGDGTVPFEGAVPPFLPYESLVCITPGDFGFAEIGDKIAAQVGGFHGILPNMNMLHRLIVRFFTGRDDPHEATWGRPAPGVDDWEPPLPLTRRRTPD